MGGEKLVVTGFPGTWIGSPPRGRGKVPNVSVEKISQGITPAWAGKRYRDGRLDAAVEDHPRVGGEKFVERTAAHLPPGSPPRGRGKGPHLQKTAVRGGSPPRGRGKVHRCQIGPWLPGITPAWAGKSVAYCWALGAKEDHPRMGGEKGARRGPALGRTGSPPHGRGKVGPHTARKYAAGITPAWAGKRSCVLPTRTGSRDHPRMGGEKTRGFFNPPDGRGSPPHGRGKDCG